MSYEKYIKYKTKYLNLKTKIHNDRIQMGGASNNFIDNDFLQTLGSSPNSEIFSKNFNLVGGGKKKNTETDLKLPEKLSSIESSSTKSSSSKSSSSESPIDDLPEKLSSSEEDEINKENKEDEEDEKKISDKSLETTESYNEEKLVGGARKLKKKKNVFSESDSELGDSESSLLSFSSIESNSSSD